MTTSPPARPRKASTVLVVRDGAHGPEVLMLRRHAGSAFAADAWVYPGGAVDDDDRALSSERWRGGELDRLGRLLDEPADLTLGFAVAAVRETFEEAGLLLAAHADGGEPDIESPAYRKMRADLGDRETATDFNAWLTDEDLVLDLDRLTVLARWITPVIERKRFDTCFFIARAPEGQVAAHDRVEVTDQRWVAPAEALRRADDGDWLLYPPTRHTLAAMDGFDSIAAFVAHAAAQEHIPPIQPHIELLDGGGWRAILPDDPDYPHHLYAPGGELTEAPAPEGTP